MTRQHYGFTGNFSKKYDLECGEKWYEHKPLPVIENDQVKLEWNSTIVTDNRLKFFSFSFLKDKHQ